MPLVTRNYPYGMSISMMAGLHNHASMFVDNDAIITPPLNPYLESGSSISKLGRIRKPQGGFRYAPPIMPTFTNDSLVTMGKQMDEINHEMINMLTQQRGMVFNHLI